MFFWLETSVRRQKVPGLSASQGKHYGDDLGQLIREDNLGRSASFVYEYDNAGNITAKKRYAFTTGTLGSVQTTTTYTYGDSSWKDLVTNITGFGAITYDEIGNPLTVGANSDGTGRYFTWSQGRQLSEYEFNYNASTHLRVEYTYNAEGIRTSKTYYDEANIANSYRIEYLLNGSQIVSETRYNYNGGAWTEAFTLVYLYDETGSPIGYQYRTPSYAEGVYDSYFYQKNLQGDVIAVYNQSGLKLVSYTYDAWGAISMSYSNDGASTAARYNPIRYRSYYYETETGLYYVSSRYYDPEIGRWINADGFVSTGQDITGYNMFAYCGNNPVNRKDPTGQFWITALIVTAVVAVCTVALSGCSAQPSTPSNYVQENSTNQNCYSYAFDLPHSANPGDYSVSGNSDYMFKDKNIYTPEEITGFIQRDMDALNKSVRVVDSPKDKLDNEYIVAMKTSTIVIPSIGVADYHFAVQLSDGSWADKPGQTPSRWNVLDGTAIGWDLGNIKNYYNTETVYFAVER